MIDTTPDGSWRELRRHAGTAVVLAGGVLVAATSIYVVASLLPSAVGEIGGQRLYAWSTTAFLVAQVAGTTLVAWATARVGDVAAYTAGFGLFAVGSIVCAASPSMAVMLAGRGVQGLGAGLLTGLGFAVVHSALPARLWGRGVALVSAMFGVGNLLGPALGGALAQVGAWRAAFLVLAVAAVLTGALARRALPAGAPAGDVPRIPVASLVLLALAAAAISVAALFSSPLVAAALLALAILAVLLFLRAERRDGPDRARLLPPSTLRPGSPLPAIYLTIMLLAGAVAVETYLPLFAQTLGGLPPLLAGVFAAALSSGLSASQLLTASARRPATVRALQLGGPACLAAGFAVLALLQSPDPSPARVLAWLPVLLAAGAGIGAAMPHLSVAAMSAASGLGEGGSAAAAVATVLTMATALGSALAGLVVNAAGPDPTASTRTLLTGFAVLAAVGVLTARRATRLACPRRTTRSTTTGS